MADALPLPIGPIGVNATQTPGTDGTHIHEQVTPSTVWTIEHGLGFKAPRIQLFDDTGVEFYADFDFVTDDLLTVTMAQPAAGSAYLTI